MLDINNFNYKPDSYQVKEKAKHNRDKITEVAHDFTTMFMSKMLHLMFEGVKVNPVLGGGKSEEVFRSLVLDEYAKVISNADNLMIAQKVKDSLIKLQEV